MPLGANNLSAVTAQLASFSAALRSAGTEAPEAIASAQAERGRELLQEMFASSTAPSGAPWAPPRRNYGHPLLVSTGALFGSATCTVGPRLDVDGHEITFSLTDEKAPWHHYGTSRGGRAPSGLTRKSGRHGEPARGHIPSRPLIFDDGNHGRWGRELDITGQQALDGWLTVAFRAWL